MAATVDGRFALALHGGAGARPGRDYGREIAHMRGVVEGARDALARDASALDVVVEVVAELEASGLYVAGRGGSPNLDGRFELDAGVMDGVDARAGAVAALEGFQSPVRVARAVMDASPYVLLVGAGAAAFASARGFAAVEDAANWHLRAGADESNHAPGALAHGTVGCVARDSHGRLAAATSTAGVFGKAAGRVGDTPIVGAGVWADAHAAVSCTGQGEYFIRTAAAARVAWQVASAGRSLEAATADALGEISRLGGEGGMIAVDAQGVVVMPYASPGMKRAALYPDGRIVSAAF